MTPAVFLMGIGPLARWKQEQPLDLLLRLKWAFGVAIVTAILLPLTLGHWTPLLALGICWRSGCSRQASNLSQRLAQLRGVRRPVPDTRAHAPPAWLLGHVARAFSAVGVFIHRCHARARLRSGKRRPHERLGTSSRRGVISSIDGLSQIKDPTMRPRAASSV